jgi:flagellar basal body rod protein FlgG
MAIGGIVTTARSLAYLQRLQEVTANNIANANSDAFKADRLLAWLPPGQAAPVPVRALDLRQGLVRDTGRPLDLALDGDGFLVVQTPRGERLTRGGSLHLDPAGRLVDSHGDPLLGADGPIVVQGSRVEVEADGTVQVDGAPVGRLRLETVDRPADLLKEGEGRFIPPAATRPVETGRIRVRQGAIEDANVDPLVAMVDLVAIQRAYAANLDALRAMDSVLATVASEVGRV